MTAPRALFVAPSAYLLGGLATWLDYLLPGLRSRGWNATLGLVSGPRWHRPGPYIERHPQARWLPIHSSTGTPRGRRDALVQAFERTKPDVVVSVNVPDALVAHWESSSRPGDRRAVMSIHGIQPDLFRDVELLAGGLDGVVATNRLAARLATEVGGIDPRRARYAPCGVRVPPRSHDLDPPEDTRLLDIAWVGRLEEDQKRVSDIPLVSAELTRAGVRHRIRVAGAGPARNAVEGSGHVELLGFLSDRETRELYRSADALLITPKWETGPIVAWEAMANGCPVVSSRYLGSGLEDALRHEETALLFEVGDAPAAAHELARLRDPALRTRLASAGRELVSERYSIDASVDRWDDALRGVMDQEPVRPPVPAPGPSGAGRLDDVLGPRWGERVRRVLGRRFEHGDPGGEWPHTLAGSGSDPEGFHEIALLADRSAVEVATT